MAKNNLPKIIVIVGPTASGKSDLAIRIAKKYGGEIISADSRQVYRGMDIGTGKVLWDRIKKLRITDHGSKSRGINSQFVIRNSDYYSEGVRHYLIDVASPKKQFTASDFKRLGEKAIKEITDKGKIPIIVGGTGFYIDILLGRMQTAEVKPNKKLRAKLEKQSAKQLFQRLSKLDPAYSRVIDRYNKRRLIRALEIVLSTGKPVPGLVSSIKYRVLWLGINPTKEKLAENIKKRLDKRLKQGMIGEVNGLHGQGVSWNRLDNFGLEYRWISRYLRGLISNTEMRENLYGDIIKYSKRQMTWFKKNKEINWIKNKQATDKKVTAFLSR
ncbi:MAG: tRNA (adenosine(37)-N6)-dimethylallyltransferase MiaA [Candidatus Yanofskybacteria bacterium]|nr:tRNA (adenosine(37)-N6)-dimethylallyltransferase MiaA [Candidatus Yanofskybacteria bacterium]